MSEHNPAYTAHPVDQPLSAPASSHLWPSLAGEGRLVCQELPEAALLRRSGSGGRRQGAVGADPVGDRLRQLRAGQVGAGRAARATHAQTPRAETAAGDGGRRGLMYGTQRDAWSSGGDSQRGYFTHTHTATRCRHGTRDGIEVPDATGICDR